MRQSLIFLVAGLLGGFAFSMFWGAEPRRTLAGENALSGSAPAFNGPALAQQLQRIEEQLDDERRQREVLVAEFAALRDDFDTLREQAVDVARTAEDAFGRQADGAERPPSAATIAQPGRRFGRSRGDPIAMLTDAGFSLEQAQSIDRRVEELSVAAMQARYDARRGETTPGAPGEQLLDAAAALRRELGDADYERYLTATGRSTSVNVASVLASSAAETAGLQPGDQIVTYAGERVFDVRDLNRVLLEGTAGESVLVDVVRDGQPIQIAIPRGPLGIGSGFNRQRNR